MREVAFEVMASQSYVQVHGGAGDLAEWAVDRLRELEQWWSRFLPDSDITRANLAAGAPVGVHPDTLAVVARGIEGWRQTNGLFDLTVLPALLDMGYTNSVTTDAPAPLVPGRVIGMTGFIGVDYTAGTLTVPATTALDLGGIGKGMAADIVAEELIERGATGAVVNLGGDMVVLGEPSNDASWFVGIANPFNPEQQVLQLRLQNGGLATSGTSVRTWTGIDGTRRHHIVSPQTARSADTSLVAATVLASDAATAEIFATAAMMGSADDAVSLVESVGLAGVFICNNGDIVITSTLKDFEP